jgi:endonuclease-3
MRSTSRSTEISRPASAAVLRRKTAFISRLLERRLGIPRRQSPPAPPLDMLIATILSQNTSDGNSHRAYSELRRQFPTWELVAGASPAALRTAIRTGGMANQKSVRIQETLAAVLQMYGTYDLSSIRKLSSEEVIRRLTAFKGVGAKTAACVLLFSLRRDVFPVDTHVHRLCTRLGLAPGSRTPEETFEAMKSLVPPGKAHSFHTNLIRFGRTICRPSNPRCGECPLYGRCSFEGKAAPGGSRNTPARPGRDFMLLDNV